MSVDERLTNIENMLKLLLKKEADPVVEEMICVKEAAQICGLGVKTLQNYISSGRLNIPSVKVGNKVTFKRKDVITWNAERQFITL